MRKTNLMTTGLYGLILFGCVAGAASAQTSEPNTAQAAPKPQAAAPAKTEAKVAPANEAKTDSKTDASAPTEVTADSAASANDPTTIVTVKGVKPPTRIDRQIYDNKDQIDATSGTAADALSKVPSVNVDPEGNVTLRGDSNVKVYVDGKPSVMMQGDNRAGALQAMASSDIDSIEVMTNPGSQFSAEGSAGIINLVMRKNRKPGKSGSLNVNVGDGRYNAALNGTRNSGKMTISGGVNVRHDESEGRNASVLKRLDSNGDVLNQTNSNGLSMGKNDSMSVNGGLDYNLSTADSLGLQMSYSKRENDNTGNTAYGEYDADGNPTSLYNRNSNSTGNREDTSVDLRWDHTGEALGDTLKTDLRLGRSSGSRNSANINTYSLNGTDSTDTRNNSSSSNSRDLSIDYVRPIGQNQLSLGLDFSNDTNTSSNLAIGGNASGLTSTFSYVRDVNAAYVTYQMPLGERWTILGGLRVESLDLETNAVTSGTTSHTTDTKLAPSAFATYVLSDTSKLRFSYSHHLRRPNPRDLNPFRTYVNEQNVSQGNPDLKAQESDSLELGYEVSKGATSYQIRAYYRKENNNIVDYSYFETPGVLLSTKRNFGSSQSSGLEGNFNGKLTPKLSMNLNGNIAVVELSTPTGSGKQSGTSLRGRISMDYQATDKDRFQISYFTSGKQLTGQGYRAPFSMANMSYRHQVTPKAAFVATVNDPFRTGKFKSVTDTDTIYSEFGGSRQSPTVMIGLTYLLGGSAAAQNNGDRGGWRGRGGGGFGGPF
ncbi:MAG: TonB-dependent receptor [Asticcacaulis sp.]